VADHIFAHEMTITGSIGVIGAQFDLSAFWAKLMVNWDSISTGDNADLNSMSKPLSEGAKERYNTMMDSIYDAFLNRVAEGRNLSYSSVDEIARGRVWSGKRALDIELVDSLGGLHDALLWAAKDLGHEDIDSAGIVIVPSPRAGLDAIFSLLGVSAGKLVNVATQLDDLHALTETAPVESLIQIQQDLAHQKGINVYTPNPIQ
jgi:protease-4